MQCRANLCVKGAGKCDGTAAAGFNGVGDFLGEGERWVQYCQPSTFSRETDGDPAADRIGAQDQHMFTF
ncbi:hypothetical protein D3C85_1862050 [compost metagenome]